MQKENKENTIDNTNTKSNKNKDGIYKASRAAVHFHVWLQNESGGNTNVIELRMQRRFYCKFVNNLLSSIFLATLVALHSTSYSHSGSGWVGRVLEKRSLEAC